VNHADVVAILNTDGDTTAVWHVDISPVAPLSRLCGAWVADDDTLHQVVAERLLLPVGDELPAAVVDLVQRTSSPTAGIMATLKGR
jgi:hypothetical protein